MTESTQPGARERVFAACQALAETGERITVAAVRRAAGVSMQEASDGVRAWRQTQAQAQSVPEPPEAVARALRGVWGTALSAARAEAEHLTAQARAARDQAEAEAAELLAAVAPLLQDTSAHPAAVVWAGCADRAELAAGLRFCVGCSTVTGGNATLDWAFAGVTEEAASASRNAAPISRWVRLLSAAFRRSPTTRPSAFTDTLGLPIHANSFTTRL